MKMAVIICKALEAWMIWQQVSTSYADDSGQNVYLPVTLNKLENTTLQKTYWQVGTVLTPPQQSLLLITHL